MGYSYNISVNLSLVSAVTIVSNFIIILLFCGDRSLRNLAEYSFFNLAVADMLTGILCLFQALPSGVFGVSPNQDLCFCFVVTIYWCSTVSLFILFIICLERYVTIRHHASFYRIRSKWVLQPLLPIPWLLVFVLFIIPMVTTYVMYRDGDNYDLEIFGRCYAPFNDRNKIRLKVYESLAVLSVAAGVVVFNMVAFWNLPDVSSVLSLSYEAPIHGNRARQRQNTKGRIKGAAVGPNDSSMVACPTQIKDAPEAVSPQRDVAPPRTGSSEAAGPSIQIVPTEQAAQQRRSTSSFENTRKAESEFHQRSTEETPEARLPTVERSSLENECDRNGSSTDVKASTVLAYSVTRDPQSQHSGPTPPQQRRVMSLPSCLSQSQSGVHPNRATTSSSQPHISSPSSPRCKVHVVGQERKRPSIDKVRTKTPKNSTKLPKLKKSKAKDGHGLLYKTSQHKSSGHSTRALVAERENQNSVDNGQIISNGGTSHTPASVIPEGTAMKTLNQTPDDQQPPYSEPQSCSQAMSSQKRGICIKPAPRPHSPRLLSLLLTTSALCWSPYIMLRLDQLVCLLDGPQGLEKYEGVCRLLDPESTVCVIVQWVVYFNSAVNPLLCLTLHRKFRSAFLKELRLLLGKRRAPAITVCPATGSTIG